MVVIAGEKLVQTRVLTNCPLCGFRQRVERLTGGAYQVFRRAAALNQLGWPVVIGFTVLVLAAGAALTRWVF